MYIYIYGPHLVASQNQFGINGVQPCTVKWSYNRQVTTSRVIMLLDTIKVWGSPDLQTATGRGIC